MGTTGHSRVRQMGLVIAMIAVALLSAACFPTSTVNQTPAFSGPPVVILASPLTNDTYQEGVGINILVRVENAGPDIARVAISVDGQIIGEAPLPNPDGAASFTVRNGWPATGVGTHVISAVASRSDGTVSQPVQVQINVVAAPAQEQPTSTSTQTLPPAEQPTTDAGGQSAQPTNPPAQPTNPPAQPTNPPAEPTNPPAPTVTPTVGPPQVRVISGANVRSGPGVVFEPPVGSLAAGATAPILAVHTSGTWYKIQYYNGEAWIFSQVVEVLGDASSLPRDAGPATPIPVTPTPAPTATVASAVDLTIDATKSSISQFPLVCNVASEARITVVNTGTSPSPAVTLVWDDVYNTGVVTSTNAPVPALQPGQSTQIVMYLTVSTNYGELHTARITVDPANAAPETNETNNVYANQYQLARGTCP